MEETGIPLLANLSIEQPTVEGRSDGNRPLKPVLQNTPISSGGSAGDQMWKGRRLRLVLSDDFNSALDTSEWNHAVTLSGGGVRLY